MKKRRPYGMYVTGQRPASAHLYFEVFRIPSGAAIQVRYLFGAAMIH